MARGLKVLLHTYLGAFGALLQASGFRGKPEIGESWR
jgi:hypothetical protein